MHPGVAAGIGIGDGNIAEAGAGDLVPGGLLIELGGRHDVLLRKGAGAFQLGGKLHLLLCFVELQVQGARVELSKVVWPTREETIQTTIVVLVVALLGGVLFWLLDFFLLWITTRITGQGSL